MVFKDHVGFEDQPLNTAVSSTLIALDIFSFKPNLTTKNLSENYLSIEIAKSLKFIRIFIT